MEIASGKYQSTVNAATIAAKTGSMALDLERERDVPGFLLADRDRLRLPAELFVHGLDRVRARRQSRQRKRSVGPGHGIERMVDDAEERAHPFVHVTGERIEHF